VIIPWTTAKFRLSGSRQSAGAQSLAAAPVSNTSVNSLSDLYPSQPQQLYPSKSASQVADLPMLTRFTDLDDIFISVESADALEQAKQQITAVLRERHHLADDTPDDFRMRDWTEITATIATTNALISNLLMIVAMISLIVGGVGIMNIMLVAVTERTREIGIRMAVGARSGDILRQFLIEASILCFAGGLVGIALGRFVSWSVTQVLGWPTLSSVPAIAAAVVVSVLVGLVFGIYPAWTASRLDPIDALRHE
jgi:ABC-type antimicrobial peptide transport system permease subunit